MSRPLILANCYRQFGLDPCTNMAMDEWLFARALEAPGTVALRVYTWSPGGITFGYNQRREKAVVHEALGPTPLIRRVTGGRALYHDPSELTYAVVINSDRLADERFTGSVAAASGAIAEALTSFLLCLGVQSQYLRSTEQADRRANFFHTAPCFASAARHEIVADHRKIVASAQRRIGTTLLQHGSIKLSGVVYHAALDGPVCPVDRLSAADPLSAQQFHDLSSTFFAAVGESLGLACEAKDLGESDVEEVARRAEEVRRNSSHRRDIIKHEDVGGSL